MSWLARKQNFEHPFLNLGGLVQIFGGFRADVDIWNTLLLSPGPWWSVAFGTLEAGIPIAACFGACVESLASSSRLSGLLQLQMRNLSSSAAPNFLVTATDIGVSRPGHGESRPDWVVGYYCPTCS